MTATTAVRERPILFSAEMVRLLLAGEKTQTRRVVKLPKHIAHDEVELQRMQGGYPDGVRPVWEYDEEPNAFSTRCPFGLPGDRLWVRETWCHTGTGVWTIADARGATDGTPIYKADRDEWRGGEKWWPSIHMPRWFSRLSLEITDVRVEQLQDISDEDAQAEGAFFDGTYWRGGVHPIKGTLQYWPSPKRAFEAIWRTINGEESWAQNPWVWVVSFSVVPQNGGAA
jgi:hypothetical protein